MTKSKAIELLAKGEIQIYVDVKKTKLLKSILEKAFSKDKTTDLYIRKSNIKNKYFAKANHFWSACQYFVSNIKIVNLSEIKKEKKPAPISAEQMAKNLIDNFRIVLMSEDTECGNEIICTEIAKKHAKIQAYNMIKESRLTKNKLRAIYWVLVIKKIDEYVS